jgi:hypothetical protein
MGTKLAIWGLCLALTAAIALPARAATFDLTGEWEIDPTAGVVEACPDLVPNSMQEPVGMTATIEQDGDAFVMTITNGYACEPAWSCELSGSIDGEVYTGGSEGLFDDGGGYLAQTIELTATAADAGFGTLRGDYTSDEESCFWEYEFDLDRVTPADEVCATASPGRGAGPGLIGLLIALF